MVNMGGYGLGGYAPYVGGDFGWRLHEGFNAQFGMSLTAGLGKHAFGLAFLSKWIRQISLRECMAQI